MGHFCGIVLGTWFNGSLGQVLDGVGLTFYSVLFLKISFMGPLVRCWMELVVCRDGWREWKICLGWVFQNIFRIWGEI